MNWIVRKSWGWPIDTLHKWRLNLNNNTLYILSLVFMFLGFFTWMWGLGCISIVIQISAPLMQSVYMASRTDGDVLFKFLYKQRSKIWGGHDNSSHWLERRSQITRPLARIRNLFLIVWISLNYRSVREILDLVRAGRTHCDRFKITVQTDQVRLIRCLLYSQRWKFRWPILMPNEYADKFGQKRFLLPRRSMNGHRRVVESML